MQINYKLHLYLLVLFITKSFFLISESIPVIIIHSNDANHLGDVLWQAKQYNERVILLGDDKNKHRCMDAEGNLNAEYHPIANYNKASSYFSTIYKHMTHLSYDFEFSCFARWFILEEFMRLNDIPIAFYCDSDVMLYCNITEEYNVNFKHHRMSVMQVGFSGGLVSYWDRASADAWVSFLRNFYEDPQINWYVNEYNHNRIWIHDDTPMLSNFVAGNRANLNIGNLGRIINNAAFDPVVFWTTHIEDSVPQFRYQSKSVDIPNYAVMQLKDIVWHQNLPHCYNIDLNALIRFKSLHFQGDTKKVIKDYKKAKF